MSLDLCKHPEASPIATESELRLAFAMRLALHGASDAMDELAHLLTPYGISLADVQEGLPQHTLRD